MRTSTIAATASLLAVALLSTACSGSGDDGVTAPSPTDQASAEAGGEDRWPGLSMGVELDPADAVPGGAGFAWEVDGAVLLTGTTGLPVGHLLDVGLDRRASDLLAAPVLADADGSRLVVTSGAIVTLESGVGLPLAADFSYVIEEESVTVFGPDAEERATIAGTVGTFWVSATGSVIGNFEGVAYDVEADAPTDVPDGCRVADRHVADDPLLVCADDTSLGGPGKESLPGLPTTSARFGWTTVGTTGDEYVANLHDTADPTGPARVMTGSRAADTIDIVLDHGAALLFRSSNRAWVADLADGALMEYDPAGPSVEVLREMPGVTDAMVWTR